MTFPLVFELGAFRVPAHLVFETLAYTIGFAVYRHMRNRRGDPIDDSTRWTVIAAAAVGAAIGSKVLFWLEEPGLTLAWVRTDPAMLMGGKTIVGGLLGGTIAVELAKRVAGERRSTGDLFVIPLCIGIAVGRIGCFVSGLADHTYGTPTSLPWAVDFGDGIPRHPTQIYEIVSVLVLAVVLQKLSRRPLANGDLFKIFMLAYLAFRVAVDAAKPAELFAGLSSIQWAAVIAIACYARYVPAMLRTSRAARMVAA